jgi:hypothetical protein
MLFGQPEQAAHPTAKPQQGPSSLKTSGVNISEHVEHLENYNSTGEDGTEQGKPSTTKAHLPAKRNSISTDGLQTTS